MTGASALCYNFTMLQSSTLIFRDVHIVWSRGLQTFAFSYKGHEDVVSPASTSEFSAMEMLRYAMDNYDEVLESCKELFIRSEILGRRYEETGSL